VVVVAEVTFDFSVLESDSLLFLLLLLHEEGILQKESFSQPQRDPSLPVAKVSQSVHSGIVLLTFLSNKEETNNKPKLNLILNIFFFL